MTGGYCWGALGLRLALTSHQYGAQQDRSPLGRPEPPRPTQRTAEPLALRIAQARGPPQERCRWRRRNDAKRLSAMLMPVIPNTTVASDAMPAMVCPASPQYSPVWA